MERTQWVSYDDITSVFTDVKYGVPQGSVLGPLLFIYILYISQILAKLFNVMEYISTALIM